MPRDVMKPRRDRRRPLTLKAVWTVPELAAAAGMERWQMRRLLERSNVPMRRNGSRRPLEVALTHLIELRPDLVTSIQRMQEIPGDSD